MMEGKVFSKENLTIVQAQDQLHFSQPKSLLSEKEFRERLHDGFQKVCWFNGVNEPESWPTERELQRAHDISDAWISDICDLYVQAMHAKKKVQEHIYHQGQWWKVIPLGQESDEDPLVTLHDLNGNSGPWLEPQEFAELKASQPQPVKSKHNEYLVAEGYAIPGPSTPKSSNSALLSLLREIRTKAEIGSQYWPNSVHRANMMPLFNQGVQSDAERGVKIVRLALSGYRRDLQMVASSVVREKVARFTQACYPKAPVATGLPLKNLLEIALKSSVTSAVSHIGIISAEHYKQKSNPVSMASLSSDTDAGRVIKSCRALSDSDGLGFALALLGQRLKRLYQSWAAVGVTARETELDTVDILLQGTLPPDWPQPSTEEELQALWAAAFTNTYHKHAEAIMAAQSNSDQGARTVQGVKRSSNNVPLARLEAIVSDNSNGKGGFNTYLDATDYKAYLELKESLIKHGNLNVVKVADAIQLGYKAGLEKARTEEKKKSNSSGSNSSRSSKSSSAYPTLELDLARCDAVSKSKVSLWGTLSTDRSLWDTGSSAMLNGNDDLWVSPPTAVPKNERMCIKHEGLVIPLTHRGSVRLCKLPSGDMLCLENVWQYNRIDRLIISVCEFLQKEHADLKFACDNSGTKWKLETRDGKYEFPIEWIQQQMFVDFTTPCPVTSFNVASHSIAQDQPTTDPQLAIVTKILAAHKPSHMPMSEIFAKIRANELPDIRPSDLKGLKESDIQCRQCLQAKLTDSPHPASTRSHASRAAEELHFDLYGPEHIASRQRYTHVAVVTDKFTGYRFIIGLEYRHMFAQQFVALIDFLERMTGERVVRVRSDNAPEFTPLCSTLTNRGIAVHRSVPHIHQQNGTAEASIRAVMDAGRPSMMVPHMPAELWYDALVYATMQRNCWSSSDRKSPYEQLFKRSPPTRKWGVFGSDCVAWVPPAQRRDPSTGSSNKTVRAPHGNAAIYLGVAPFDFNATAPVYGADLVFDLEMKRVRTANHTVALKPLSFHGLQQYVVNEPTPDPDPTPSGGSAAAAPTGNIYASALEALARIGAQPQVIETEARPIFIERAPEPSVSPQNPDVSMRDDEPSPEPGEDADADMVETETSVNDDDVEMQVPTLEERLALLETEVTRQSELVSSSNVEEPNEPLLSDSKIDAFSDMIAAALARGGEDGEANLKDLLSDAQLDDLAALIATARASQRGEDGRELDGEQSSALVTMDGKPDNDDNWKEIETSDEEHDNADYPENVRDDPVYQDFLRLKYDVGEIKNLVQLQQDRLNVLPEEIARANDTRSALKALPSSDKRLALPPPEPESVNQALKLKPVEDVEVPPTKRKHLEAKLNSILMQPMSECDQDDLWTDLLDCCRLDKIEVEPLGLREEDVPIPDNVRQARNSPYWKYWEDAIEDEFRAFEENEVGIRIPITEVPKGVKPVKSRMVFASKTTAMGIINRFKARLCAKGFSQIEGIDYDEIFAPVISFKDVLLLVALSTIYKMCMYTIDIKTAFLNSELDKEIYMYFPPGYEQDENGVPLILKLQKALYGLKQSPKLWYDNLSEWLESRQFTATVLSPNIMYRGEGKDKIIIGIYVDDLLIISESENSIKQFCEEVENKYQVNPPEKVNKFLGLQIAQNDKRDRATVCMQEYIEKVVARFGKAKLNNKFSTPISSDAPFEVEESHVDSKRLQDSEKTEYQELVGCLRFLCVGRPDIHYAVRRVSQFNANPQVYHQKLALRILSYLNNTKMAKIEYGNGGELGKDLQVYSDASFMSSVDDGRSVQGHIVMFGGGPIDWLSKQIKTANRSTTDSELIALHTAIGTACRYRTLLGELGHQEPGPTIVYEDNKGAYDAVGSSKVYKGESYVVKKLRYIKDVLLGYGLKLKLIGTKDQMADQFTKPLGRQPHYEMNKRIGCNLPWSGSGGVQD